MGPEDEAYKIDARRILKQCKDRIALQVGDDDILKGPDTIVELTKNCEETQECALLTDSAISSCCPDMLTAKKYCSDSLILMTSAAVCETGIESVVVKPPQIALPTAIVKVLQLPLQVNDWALINVMNSLSETINLCDPKVPTILSCDSNLKWIIEYLIELRSDHISDEVCKVLDQIKTTSWNDITQHFESFKIRLNNESSFKFDNFESKWTACEEVLDLGRPGHIVCYLSSCESSNHTTMALNYAKTCDRIKPQLVKPDSKESGFITGQLGGVENEGEIELLTSSGSNPLSKLIMSRMSSINYAKELIEQELSNDSDVSIGLVVTNPHLGGVVRMRDRLSYNLRMSKLKTIKVYMAKVNPQKLDNFYGVKLWVIITCPIETNRLLSESDSYRIPLITPWELEVALNCRDWTIEQPYSLDQLLSDDRGYRQKNMEMKTIIGSDTEEETAIQRQNQDWSVAMPLQNNLVHFSKRSDVACPYASVTCEASTIEEGLSGIASVYEN